MRQKYFNHTPTKIIAAAELVVAGAFWGLGYVAAKWSLQSMGPFAVVFLRFIIAAVLGWSFIRLSSPGWSNPFQGELWRSHRAGVALGVTLILQTLGLQYTSVTRCGFLTGLYVVFVPILESMLLRRAIPGVLWFWIAVATLGTCLMCGLDSTQGWNVGDTFSLGCAMAASYQIVMVDKISSRIKSPFAFNAGQSFWALLPALVFMLWSENLPYLPWTSKSWIGIGILSLGCTLLSFWLQVRAQMVLTATIVSILFLLESPFAAVFGYVFFDERLNLQQSLGAVLILVACWKTITLDRKPALRA
jgi:drug/metabolite transporter (DMT)-like permease